MPTLSIAVCTNTWLVVRFLNRGVAGGWTCDAVPPDGIMHGCLHQADSAREALAAHQRGACVEVC